MGTNGDGSGEPYVEVIGEASYEEPIETFHATVELEVRAVKEKTALAQLAGLVKRCVGRLLEAGLQRDEVEDGGAGLTEPWWQRRKDKPAGKVGRHRLLLKCPRLPAMMQALAATENVPAGTRESIQVTMGPPTFRSDDAVRLDALRRAVGSARRSAEALARADGADVGRALRVEEGTSAARASGFSGDLDWMGDYPRFGATAGAGGGFDETGPMALATPARTIWVRCRVRFQLRPAGASRAPHA